MKSRVKWLDNMSFVGESASGHSVVMDGPAEAGGRDLGIRPMEMLLLGLGGCSSFDVVSILKKGQQNIHNCEVEISATRADSEPRVFTDIHLHFIIEGENINEAKVARAINLSAEKYCSASIMLAKTAKVTYDYEIL
jgi:putative redox protein